MSSSSLYQYQYIYIKNLRFGVEFLPGGLHRRCGSCTLLDAAASAGSVEVVRFLLSFHRGKVTAETFAMSLSGGNFEMIRLI